MPITSHKVDQNCGARDTQPEFSGCPDTHDTHNGLVQCIVAYAVFSVQCSNDMLLIKFARLVYQYFSNLTCAVSFCG